MAILGMRGTGSFGTYERPKNYRQGILLLNPNGDAPLTAILSKLKEQPTNDPQFYWYEKGIPLQRGQIVGALTNESGTPVSGNNIAAAATDASGDSTVIALLVGTVATAAANSTSDASIFKPGHVLYNEVGDETYLVLDVNYSTNILKVKRNMGGKYTLGTNNPAITGNQNTTGDTITIVGSGFPEGAPIGSAIAYQPAKHFNYTQIFRTPLSVTRTARKTALRWSQEGAYSEAKRESLQLHAVEMERAFLFGAKSETTTLTSGTYNTVMDPNSGYQPIRTTQGILNWLPTATTSSVSVHTNLTSYNSGVLTEAIADSFFEEVFRYGSSEKLGLVGSTALNVITQLAKNKAMIEMIPTDQTYGLSVRRYLTPFGSLMLMNHPLLSENPVWRKDMYVIDTDKLSYRYITDTTFLTNRQAPGDDATKDEWLTEAGLEVHFSGATPDSTDGGISTVMPAAHGRISGIASYGG